MDDDANEFTGYDAGWRLGTFDKCNGKPDLRATQGDFPESPYNVGFFDGYGDAFDSNERKI